MLPARKVKTYAASLAGIFFLFAIIIAIILLVGKVTAERTAYLIADEDGSFRV